MAIDASSYGSMEGVGSNVGRLAKAAPDFFDLTTRPTLAQVETYIDQVSSMLNVVLAQHGFITPVTDADNKRMLDLFVNSEVGAIVEGINGSGRFRSLKESPMVLVSEDIRKFIENMAVGMERLGAAREFENTSGVGYRSTDERGNETHPLFQRDAFGNEPVNWDAD